MFDPGRKKALSTRGGVLAFAGSAALALAVFRPAPEELAQTLPAFGGVSADALLLTWAMGHVSRTLFADPLHLFDGRIFHPARDTLAYGDHMIGQALVGMPVWMATDNLVLEYNLLLLLSYTLGATALFLYAREHLGNTAAAVAAGVAFAFTPYRFHSPTWLQVLCTPFAPLADGCRGRGLAPSPCRRGAGRRAPHRGRGTEPARHVRLVNPDLGIWGGSWEIAELEVFAAEPEPSGP